MHKYILLITSIILIQFSILNASDTLKLIPYEPILKQKITSEENTKEDLNLGMALLIKTNKKSHFNYIVAYEGDYMVLNSHLKKANQIKKTNYYLKIKYNF